MKYVLGMIAIACAGAFAAFAGDLTVDNMTVHGTLSVTQLTQQGSASTNGLRVHYTFDNDSGTNIVDVSGRGNNGTLYGSPAYVSSRTGFGLGLQLTQNGHYIIAPGADLNVSGWSAITMSVWVMLRNHWTPYGPIVRRGDALDGNSQGGFQLNIAPTWNGSGSTFLFASSTNGFGATYPQGVSYPEEENWFLVTATYDGTNICVYYNGVLDSTTPVSPSGTTLWDYSGSKMVIGNSAQVDCMGWSDMFMGGVLDELRIYDRPLTSNEVYNLYIYTGNVVPSSVRLYSGVEYVKPLGDLPMGSYTNSPQP